MSARPVKEGPDSVQIDDELLVLSKEKPMADIDPTLSKANFRSLIRLVMMQSLENVTFLQAQTHQALKRLGVKRDVTKAAKRVPRGSDQINMSGVLHWLNNVPKDNPDAVAQVVAVDATCVRRTQG